MKNILRFEEAPSSASMEPALTTPWVPVEQEPQHHFRFANDYIHVYEVKFYAHEHTLYHRHDQDTFYVNVNNIKVYDVTFGDETGEYHDMPAGIGMCRGHKEKPLIHQITNETDHLMHMVGAEYLKPSPVKTKNQWQDSHVTALDNIGDSQSVISYQIDIAPGDSMKWNFDFYGLMVVISDASLQITQDGNSRIDGYLPGHQIWYENPPEMQVKNVGELPFIAVLGVWT